MPNWCECVFVFSHESEAVIRGLGEKHGELLQTLRPMPEGVDEYQWRLAHWGTKSEVAWARITMEPALLENGRWEVEIMGDCAWGPPTDALAWARAMDPGLVAECAFYEPGLGFVGLDEGAGEEIWQLEGYDLNVMEEVDRLCDDLPGKLVGRLGLHARLYGDIAMLEGYARALGEL